MKDCKTPKASGFSANRLTGISGPVSATFTYDADGNFTSQKVNNITTAYAWNSAGQLVWVAKNGKTVSFSYNALGCRIGKTADGKAVAFVYDGAEVAFALDATDPEKKPGGLNFYAYVENNPLRRVDPWGLFHCVGGANCDFTPAINSALECFDECTGRDTAITGGRGNRNRSNSSHARGEACDIGRNSNPDLSRDNAEQCFSNGYGQEEGNGPNIPGTHFHFQLNPVP